MTKYFLCIVILIGIVSTLAACDSHEEPFVISNNLPQPVNLQILCVYSDNFPKPTVGLTIGREGQSYESSLQLGMGETGKIFAAGVNTGRTGYIIVVNDESGKELFRQTFPRNDLIKHKFKLTITEKGIEYSS